MSGRSSAVDYDEIGRIYDTSRWANRETLEKLARLLGVGSDSTILDLGCGTGNYAGPLGRAAKTVVGVDLSTGMLKQARAKFAGLRLVRGDVTALPFASESFDGAFAVQVLHHVKEKELFLAEAYRVLRKGACLAIDSCSHQQMRTFWFYHYFPGALEIDLARIPDRDEIVSLLERAGFSHVGSEVSYADVALEHEKPERYLDRDYRNGQSTFCLLREEDVESGCEKLRKDITSGAVGGIIRHGEAEEAVVGGSSIIHGCKTALLLRACT